MKPRFKCPPFGQHLTSRLHRLVRNFRDVWQSFCAVWRGADENLNLTHSDTGLELLQRAHQLVRMWFDVFDCLRAAEGWLYREYGPQEDTELLDELAASLEMVYEGIDCMRVHEGEGRGTMRPS